MNYAMYFSELYSTGCSSNCEPHDIRYQPKRQPKYGGSRIGSQVEHCHSTRTPAQATQSSNGKRTYRSNVHLRTTLHIHLDVRLRRGAGTTITSTCCSLVPRLPQGRSSCRCIVCDSHYVISHSKHAQRILDLFAHFTGTVSRRQRQWRSSLQKRRTLSADSWTNARVS